MKKLLIAILLMSGINAGVPSDKFQHMAAGFIIYGSCLMFASATDDRFFDTTTCLIPVAIAGAGKEIYDSTHDGHQAEWADLGLLWLYH